MTSNGYWQKLLGDATYYVVGAGLSQTAESVAEANTSTSAQPVTKSYNPYFVGEVLESRHLNSKDGRIYIENASGGTWGLTEYRKVTW